MGVSPRIFIIGLGAVTPIGRNVWASAAAARAGICGFSMHPYMIDTAGEPMRIARAPWLDIDLQGAERLCELLFPAVDEALVPLGDQLSSHHIRIGLALGLPSVRLGLSTALSHEMQKTIENRYPSLFASIKLFEVGHAAGHLALSEAVKNCAPRLIDVCVVAGVDSYINPETLEWVEECDQLHGGGALNNAWGFVPGEAAGALLIATETFARKIHADAYGEIVGIGIGQEKNLIKTDSVCVGEGLTQAFRQALQLLAPDERIHNVFCDLNGETYRASEYGFTTLRTKEHFCSATDFIAPADCWGDVGAASAPLHATLSVISYRKRYGKGPLSMVWGSSEAGERGAAVIRGMNLSKG